MGEYTSQWFILVLFWGIVSLILFVGGAFVIPVWGIEKALIFVLFLKFLIFTWWQYDKKRGL